MLRSFRPITPGQRHRVDLRLGLGKSSRVPHGLTHPHVSTGGRNNRGRITALHRGGGVKRRLRRERTYRRVRERRAYTGRSHVDATIVGIQDQGGPRSVPLMRRRRTSVQPAHAGHAYVFYARAPHGAQPGHRVRRLAPHGPRETVAPLHDTTLTLPVATGVVNATASATNVTSAMTITTNATNATTAAGSARSASTTTATSTTTTNATTTAAPHFRRGPRGRLPRGSAVYAIARSGNNATAARAAGLAWTLVTATDTHSVRRMPSGTRREVASSCYAQTGRVGGVDHLREVVGKAGRNRNWGIRPSVRGAAKNPVDHPHGGRTRGGGPERTPWGRLARGVKTRNVRMHGPRSRWTVDTR